MKNSIAGLLVVPFLLMAAGLNVVAQQAPATPPPAPAPSLLISSSSIVDVTAIPTKYTCSATSPPPGGPRNISTGISPALQWTNVPKGTASFVLILHDPDAHRPNATTDITHWLVFNIPGDATQLPENVAPELPLAGGALQGNNMLGKAAYQGPCAGPPAFHHYTFELLALDTKLDLPQGATRDQVQDAVKGHVLGSSVLIGLFHR
jgi:Raf kinase inhibitor-like YbhB/YbcL family protein